MFQYNVSIWDDPHKKLLDFTEQTTVIYWMAIIFEGTTTDKNLLALQTIE